MFLSRLIRGGRYFRLMMIKTDADEDGMDCILMSVAKPQAPSEGGASKELYMYTHAHTYHTHTYTSIHTYTYNGLASWVREMYGIFFRGDLVLNIKYQLKKRTGYWAPMVDGWRKPRGLEGRFSEGRCLLGSGGSGLNWIVDGLCLDIWGEGEFLK